MEIVPLSIPLMHDCDCKQFLGLFWRIISALKYYKCTPDRGKRVSWRVGKPSRDELFCCKIRSGACVMNKIAEEELFLKTEIHVSLLLSIRIFFT